MTEKPARVLVIAGSDSSGGAGIQADIKTATALGAYAMTAITAITVQDTTGVYFAQDLPARLVRDQILSCLRDIGVDAIKTGMMASAEVVETVADTLAAYAADIPIIVDPVIGPTAGESFLDEPGIRALRARLIPLATLSTPNVHEARTLWGIASDVIAVAQLQKNAVLVTGIEDDEGGSWAPAWSRRPFPPGASTPNTRMAPAARCRPRSLAVSPNACRSPKRCSVRMISCRKRYGPRPA